MNSNYEIQNSDIMKSRIQNQNSEKGNQKKKSRFHKK